MAGTCGLVCFSLTPPKIKVATRIAPFSPQPLFAPLLIPPIFPLNCPTWPLIGTPYFLQQITSYRINSSFNTPPPSPPPPTPPPPPPLPCAYYVKQHEANPIIHHVILHSFTLSIAMLLSHSFAMLLTNLRNFAVLTPTLPVTSLSCLQQGCTRRLIMPPPALFCPLLPTCKNHFLLCFLLSFPNSNHIYFLVAFSSIKIRRRTSTRTVRHHSATFNIFFHHVYIQPYTFPPLLGIRNTVLSFPQPFQPQSFR